MIFAGKYNRLLDAYKYARLLKLATSLKEIIYLDQSNFEEKRRIPNKNANALKEMALREATIDNLKLTVETYGRIQNPKFVSTLKFDIDTQIKPMWDSLMNETSNLVKILLEIDGIESIGYEWGEKSNGSEISLLIEKKDTSYVKRGVFTPEHASRGNLSYSNLDDLHTSNKNRENAENLYVLGEV